MPVVEEALFLASPDLHAQLSEWLLGNTSDKKKKERFYYALMKYLPRMCTRPTPFGLFAGFCIGRWTDQNHIQLPPQTAYSRHTRLDMNYLCALAQELANHPDIKGKIKYYPNSSIYPVGEQLRYVEYRYDNTRRTHHIVAVDFSDYLDRVLQAASKGAYLSELAALLEDKENDISLDEAAEFINELIGSQLLVNELEPAITGPEFLDQILTVLKDISGIDEIRQTILNTRASLETMDKKPIGTTVSDYSRIAENLKPLNTAYELKFLFQTDMVIPMLPENNTLDREIAADVMAGMEICNKLTLPPATTTMDQFREAFFERYETREVPLLQALDTESGIGYRQTGNTGDIAPLVDDLAIAAQGQGNTSDMKWDRIQSFIFGKYREALQENKYEVELTDKELEPFEAHWDDLPDTISAMVQIVSLADKDVPGSRPKIVVSGFGGSSAGNLLGRFCHADLATDTFVREITAQEGLMNPNAILAEILHLPESRVGNVMLRPVLRDYEIPYLAKPAVTEEFQIKLEDLMVSVKGNRIQLRSKRLNKIIIPRLTNAHNYSYNALPIYHFLADLQTQGWRGGISFGWGVLTNEYKFLPRVIYKNLILSPATWNIKKEELEELSAIKEDNRLLEAIPPWRKKRNIPACVLLADNDNKLFINLDNLMCMRTLFSIAKNRPYFQLQEFLFQPGPNNELAVVKHEEEAFTNEFVFCFYNTKKAESPQNGPVASNRDPMLMDE